MTPTYIIDCSETLKLTQGQGHKMKVKHAIRDKPDATYVRLGVQPLFFDDAW